MRRSIMDGGPVWRAGAAGQVRALFPDVELRPGPSVRPRHGRSPCPPAPRTSRPPRRPAWHGGEPDPGLRVPEAATALYTVAPRSDALREAAPDLDRPGLRAALKRFADRSAAAHGCSVPVR
ncbi:hypothetical protein [Streptomyces sp. CB03238]|uniref:hypothetical protein n=1 Tax=Streptomyces sp. CB03238 TaxID=1907777 RepID=UPI00117C2ED3|nr:hypothetical protein [Streptomyces sp. CB03238]